MEFKKRNPKIFVISGKANSGKDTTAEIIDNQIMLKGLKVVNLQISSYIKMYASKISGWDGSEDTKPRTLLQELGTSIIREKIDNEFFIKRLIGDIEVYSYYFDAITISDGRLPEQLDGIYNAFDNVYRINIVRPNYDNHLNAKELKHRTEVGLDNYDNYEYKIVNDGSLEDLSNKIRKIVDEVIKNEKTKQ